jgi:hypothetical protein
MIDADDVNVNPWDIRVILSSLKRDDWDSLSFNRKHYYDIWALLYGQMQHNCWGFGKKSRKIIKYLEYDIKDKLNKLKDNELFECYSAFNGFGIYRTAKFKGIHYDGTVNKYETIVRNQNKISTLQHFKNILNDQNISLIYEMKGSCEHLYYHLSAIRDNNVRIRISKWTLNKKLNKRYSEDKYLHSSKSSANTTTNKIYTTSSINNTNSKNNTTDKKIINKNNKKTVISI